MCSGTSRWDRQGRRRPPGVEDLAIHRRSLNAAERWGEGQESMIRRRTWIDPDEGESGFGDFADEWMSVSRRAIGTEAKYRSQLRCRIISGDDEVERQVATPAQVLRAALRMGELAGYGAFTESGPVGGGVSGVRWWASVDDLWFCSGNGESLVSGCETRL